MHVSKALRFWTPVVTLLFLLGLVAITIVGVGKPDVVHYKLLDQVELGDPLTAIEPLLENSYVRFDRVILDQQTYPHVRNRDLGDYKSALLKLKTPEHFTGSVSLFVDKGFHPVTVVFKFKDGKLVEKYWSPLPG